MSTQRARILTGAMALAGLLFTADSASAQRGDRRPELRGVVKAVDLTGRSITVSVSTGRDAAATDRVYALAADTEVAIGSGGLRGAVYHPGKVEDLTPGLSVSLAVSADEKSVESIAAEEPTVRGVLQSVDAGARTLSIQTAQQSREQPGEVKSLAVAADAEVAIDDGRARRFSIREGSLGDLKSGSQATLWLSLDRKSVRAVLAEGPSYFGTVKSVDATSNTLTITARPARGDEAAIENTYAVAPDATIVLDDGRGRRLSARQGKLTDITAGTAANVRLSVDQGRIMSIRIEGPTLFGMLKSVDAEKNTITIAFPRGRGEPPEERTVTLAKDARILSEGAEAPLSSLKPGENGPYIQLRLSLDQTQGQSVIAANPRGR